MKVLNSGNAILLMLLVLLSASCNGPGGQTQAKTIITFPKGSYGHDADFLKKTTAGFVELSAANGQSKIFISSDYQGRVMTSTASGDSGTSFGWINYGLLESGKKKAQFNPVGGEERFWLGPEGGQFGLYFKKGDSFNIAHWQVPAVIDSVAFDLVSSSASSAVFAKHATLVNYSGAVFQVDIKRAVSLLDKDSVSRFLHIAIPEDIRLVAYSSANQITNTGDLAWKKEQGLLSMWLLGMMTPSDQTIVIIPFHPATDARSLITDNYFGKIPPDRLVVKDSILYFKCDGKSRGKIGISPQIAGSIAASFDFKKNVLSLIAFPVEPNGRYVNSKWEMQKQPYRGDVVNSYNDGPLADGTQMGPFYEIESSSDAKELNPGQSAGYRQMTCHLQGSYESLRELTRKLLGVDLENIKKM